MKQTVQVEVDTTKVEQEAYKKGLDVAWDLAKRLIRQTAPVDLTRMGFGDSIRHENITEILNEFTASEALAKLRDYEARKKAEDEAVKVGDEMENIDNTNIRMIVTFISPNNCYSGVRIGDGQVYGGLSPDRWRKTGNHFPEIAAVLEQMKGE